MKPLNHKDRKQAIRKFIWSIIPVLLITLIGLWLLFENNRMHSLYIENKYNIQETKFIEQSRINEHIDSIITFGNKVIDLGITENQYRETQRQMNRSVDNCMDYSILEKKNAPYEIALNIVKKTQESLDSLHLVDNMHKKNSERLRVCNRLYNENIKK